MSVRNEPSKRLQDFVTEFLKIATQWRELAADAEAIVRIRNQMKD